MKAKRKLKALKNALTINIDSIKYLLDKEVLEFSVVNDINQYLFHKIAEATHALIKKKDEKNE